LLPCSLPAPQEKNIQHSGNISIEDIYEVARVMADRSCAATFAGTVKEMLGTAVSGVWGVWGWAVSAWVEG
jgi:ribosomal protein L11